MLKDDFALDPEIVRKISQTIASESIDEQISHHPELLSQRDRLQAIKQQDAEMSINRAVAEVLGDINMAGEYLKSWFQNLPPEKRERLQKEFKRAGEIFQSDWFINSMKTSVENPLERASPLQKVLKLSDETLQLIYGCGNRLQKDNDFSTSRSIFRFLAFLNPLIADFWVCLGFSLSNLRNYREAEACYTLASELSPQDPQGTYFSALNWTMQKEYEKALETCDSCLNLINGHATLVDWKKSVIELKTFIDSKKVQGGSL